MAMEGMAEMTRLPEPAPESPHIEPKKDAHVSSMDDDAVSKGCLRDMVHAMYGYSSIIYILYYMCPVITVCAPLNFRDSIHTECCSAVCNF